MAVMADKTNSTECSTEEMTNCPGLIKFNCLARPKARKRLIAGKTIIIYCFLSIGCMSNRYMSREEIIFSRLIYVIIRIRISCS